MAAVTFWKGTRAKFDALQEKVATRLYFCDDTGELFKGDVQYTGKLVETLIGLDLTTLSATDIATAKAMVEYVASQTELFATEQDLKDLRQVVDDINEQLGGSGDATLSARLADLEKAVLISATKTTPVVTTYGEGEDAVNKIAATYLPTIKFQGQQVASGMGQTINIIGIGNVTVDASGNITLRIGENLNCRVWNGTDGISDTTVEGEKSGDIAATVSADYSATSTGGSKRVFEGSDSITATPGEAQTTASGATDGTNGNYVHFDTNTNGYFKVYIREGLATDATEYVVGPITASGTYSATKNGVAVSGITCEINGFAAEPKTAQGASGFAAAVGFTIVPNALYSASTDFELLSIKQLEGDTEVGAWEPDATLGTTHFLLKETATATYRAGSPATATLTFNPAGTAIKKISGVTYITTAATFSVAATGLANLGYPINSGTKVSVTPAGGSWMTAFNESDTTKFNTWTTAKDITMSYTSDNKSMIRGKWDNPEVIVNGVNAIGVGASPVTTVTDQKLLVCDANGRVSASYGSFTGAETLADDALMVYDGRLVYPSVDFTDYNAGLLADGVTQPDYSAVTGTRTFTKEYSVTGTTTGGTVTLTHTASIDAALKAGSLKVEVRTQSGGWVDVSKYNGCGDAASSYGTTTSTLIFAFGLASDYPTTTSGTAVRISMTSAVAELKSIAFA